MNAQGFSAWASSGVAGHTSPGAAPGSINRLSSLSQLLSRRQLGSWTGLVKSRSPSHRGGALPWCSVPANFFPAQNSFPPAGPVAFASGSARKSNALNSELAGEAPQDDFLEAAFLSRSMRCLSSLMTLSSPAALPRAEVARSRRRNWRTGWEPFMGPKTVEAS